MSRITVLHGIAVNNGTGRGTNSLNSAHERSSAPIGVFVLIHEHLITDVRRLTYANKLSRKTVVPCYVPLKLRQILRCELRNVLRVVCYE